jgi:hypothetical protein
MKVNYTTVIFYYNPRQTLDVLSLKVGPVYIALISVHCYTM